MHHNSDNLILFRTDPIGFLRQMAQAGDIAPFRMGGRDFVLVNHPDLIKEVLVTNQQAFAKGPGLLRTEPLLGHGLLTSDGDNHRTHRRIIQPVFERSQVAAYGEMMIEEAVKTGAGWTDGATIDLHKEMTGLTLQIIGRTLFGISLESEADEIGNAVTEALFALYEKICPPSPLPQGREGGTPNPPAPFPRKEGGVGEDAAKVMGSAPPVLGAGGPSSPSHSPEKDPSPPTPLPQRGEGGTPNPPAPFPRKEGGVGEDVAEVMGSAPPVLGAGGPSSPSPSPEKDPSPPTPLPQRGEGGKRRSDRGSFFLKNHVNQILTDAAEESPLLSLLIQSGGFTERQLRDEAMTFLLAGHESVSNALSWTFHLLANHPDVRTKFEVELEQLSGKSPVPSDISKLPYTRMVIAESMRLFPPAWMVSRRALTPFSLNGQSFETGTIAIAAQCVSHNDARFFPGPDQFRPARWQSADTPRFAYFPFGAGARACIGEQFAWSELILLTATIGQMWRMDSIPGHPIEAQPIVTLRPKFGMPMRLKRR